MNSTNIARTNYSDSDFVHLLLCFFVANNPLCRGVRVACEFERISFPVLRTEYLNTRNLFITDASKCGDNLAQRENSESRQQPVSILQLIARKIFGVVDVKDVKQFRIEPFDHLDCRAAGVEMETVDNEA